MTTSSVCVDASFLIKLFVQEGGSDIVAQHWETWDEAETEVVAPSLLLYEVTSALRKKVFLNSLDRAAARIALESFLDLGLSLVSSIDLHRTALDIAESLDRPNAYDAYYLAVARDYACPFWTSDRRLYNAASKTFLDMELVG